MNNNKLEVADIFREYGEEYRRNNRLCLAQLKVMRAIEICRTAILGGHLDECDQCGHQRPSYNSCRNRHCPKCQSLAKARWIEARQANLLPVVYFHVVFTLPQQIADLALQNKKVIYGLLFKIVAETLKILAADPQHLGAQIGFFAVLHTWGQLLLHHPHLHCVVSGGGITPDSSGWIQCRRSSKGKDFFIPVKVMSALFRRLFLEALQQVFNEGELQFFGVLSPLADSTRFKKWLQSTKRMKWVVYAKKPFGGPAAVVEYLGRYTHRVAISNNRLVSMENGKVSFRWRDYRHGDIEKVMILDASEFIRRFLLHTLPRGFVRIRHFGFLSNRNVHEKVDQCRKLMGVSEITLMLPAPLLNWQRLYEKLIGVSFDVCPKCKQGRMVRIGEIHPLRFENRSPPMIRKAG